MTRLIFWLLHTQKGNFTAVLIGTMLATAFGYAFVRGVADHLNQPAPVIAIVATPTICDCKPTPTRTPDSILPTLSPVDVAMDIATQTVNVLGPGFNILMTVVISFGFFSFLFGAIRKGD